MPRRYTETTSCVLGDHRGDPDAVPGAAPQRQQHPPPQHADHRGDPQPPPEDGAGGGGEEVLPRPQLVRQRQPDSEVGVEVQQVPRLVPQLAAGRLDAGEHDHEQGDGSRDGQQHARVMDGQVPQGRRGAAQLAGGVTPGDQHDVRDQQIERGESDEPVDPGQPVLTVSVLEQRQPRHQQHLNQQQHRGQQTGQPAGGRQPGFPTGQVLDPAAGGPPVGHQQQRRPDSDERSEPDRRIEPGPGGAHRDTGNGRAADHLCSHRPPPQAQTQMVDDSRRRKSAGNEAMVTILLRRKLPTDHGQCGCGLVMHMLCTCCVMQGRLVCDPTE